MKENLENGTSPKAPIVYAWYKLFSVRISG